MSSPPGSGPTTSSTSSPLAPSLTGIIPDLTIVGYTNSQLLNFWKEISDLIISLYSCIFSWAIQFCNVEHFVDW